MKHHRVPNLGLHKRFRVTQENFWRSAIAMSSKTFIVTGATCLCLTMLWLAYSFKEASNQNNDPLGGISQERYDAIVFLDDIESNQDNGEQIHLLKFIDTHGNSVSTSKYKGQKNLLIVFTRGFSGRICPYCTTQTSRLIKNYEKFTALDTEILLIFPGSTDQLPDFKKAGLEVSGTGNEKFGFPILLDPDLYAVNKLKIADQLSKPSTLVLNKQGDVVMFYAGNNPGDRPSINALLALLETMQGQ